jgi:hypothetical protein
MTETAPVPMDEDYAALLESLGGAIIPPARTHTPQQIRNLVNTAIMSFDGPDYVPETVAAIEDTALRGSSVGLAVGVPVVYLTDPALLHGFLVVVNVVPAAAEARERIVGVTSDLIDRLTFAA